MNKRLANLVFLFLAVCWSFAYADCNQELIHLKEVYPGLFTISANGKSIVWNDGTVMPVGDAEHEKSTQEKIENPSLLDQICDVHYPVGKIDLAAYFLKNEDPGRIRYEPFARKMYGNSENEVRSHLTTIDWMPGTFKKEDGSALYQLSVTTVNQVNEKLQHISTELDELVSKEPSYKKYLSNPGGTFLWRNIANTNRLSFHSFGMTIDINVSHSNYWQWYVSALDNRPIREDASFSYYPNQIPWPIILLFEKYGFIWGGKWHHFDTMHFEYRPELFPSL